MQELPLRDVVSSNEEALLNGNSIRRRNVTEPNGDAQEDWAKMIVNYQQSKQVADEVWFNDAVTGSLSHTMKEEGKERVRAPIFESASKPHHFTSEERTKMALYESIDYWESHCLIYKEYLKERQKQRRWMKWGVFIGIGLAVGTWATFFFQTLDAGNSGRVTLFEKAVGSCRKGIDETKSMNTVPGAPYSAVFAGLGVYIAIAIVLSLASSGLCHLFPHASGSGIPDVMAYLNGVLLPKIFNIRVLVIKTISCLCAVISGLPVGAEGPTIHIGALIGAGLPSLQSKSLRCNLMGGSHGMFNSPESHRDFISAGAAAGVTAAFGSPIGGLLFVMEEIATFFPVKLAWMVFTSCLSAMTIIQLANSYIRGWEPTKRDNIPVGTFLDTSISMFNTDFIFESVTLNLITFVPTTIIGTVMGFTAVLFTFVNLRCLRFRAKKISVNPRLRIMEPILFAVVYVTICFLAMLPFPCWDLPKEMTDEVRETLELRLIQSVCKDPVKQYHPFGSLALTSAYNAIRLLYSRNTGGLFPWHALLLFQAIYTSGAVYASGMFISSGVVIPTLLIGAIGGRLTGQVIGQYSWSNPGVIALVGSAAFFGGLSRLTFSLTVIMMELTGDLSHIVMIMVGVFIAKSIADRFCHSLYHQIIEFKCVPFMDLQTDIHKFDAFPTKHIMATPVHTVRTTESVHRVVELILNTTHNCFPVVSIADNMTFRGTIQRNQLSILLWFAHFQATGIIDVDGDRHATYTEMARVKQDIHWGNLDVIPPGISDSILNSVIDLNPYVDTAALSTREVVCLSRSYYLFRYMGLRHLPVVNCNNEVVGILSRKDFVMDKLFERLDKLKETVTDDDSDK